MLYNSCESCNEVATCACECDDPPRFFCNIHISDHINLGGKHSIEAAVECLSDSEVSSLRDLYNGYRLSSLREAVKTRNSQLESLFVKIRRAEEEYSSIIETILIGPIAKDINQLLFYRALPLYSNSPVVRSLLDLKRAPDFSDFSRPSIQETIKSLNSSVLSYFASSFSFVASSTQTNYDYTTSSTQTYYDYTHSSTQTHPPSAVSVQTSSKPSFSTQHFPSQICIFKQIDPSDPTTYRWEFMKQIKDRQSSIFSIAVSDCEKYIASASADCTINIWNLQTLALLRTLKAHTNSVLSVAFLRNRIVSGSLDMTIKIWEEDRCVSTLNKHSNSVFSVCVSSCKRLIVSGSMDNTAVVFRSEDNQTLHTLTHSHAVQSVAFSPNNKEIVSGSGQRDTNGFIRIWNTETGQLLRALDAHCDWVVSVNVSGKLIASSALDKTVKVWDRDKLFNSWFWNKNKPLLTFTDHFKRVSAVDIRNDVVASLGGDNRLIIRDIKSGSIIQTLQANGSSGWGKVGLKVLEGGKFIVSGGGDGNVNVWRRIN